MELAEERADFSGTAGFGALCASFLRPVFEVLELGFEAAGQEAGDVGARGGGSGHATVGAGGGSSACAAATGAGRACQAKVGGVGNEGKLGGA